MLALGVTLTLTACTEQVPMRRESSFSWEPQSQPVWPVRGTIVSGFGDAAHPSHQGIDLAARAGEPVLAALSGRVEFAGDMAGYGKVVVLSHGNSLSTVYAHLGEVRVHDGEGVDRGQTIATLAPEGYLHYEVRQSKQAVDPARFYAVAPPPLSGGSADVRGGLAAEPSGVGRVGEAARAEAPSSPAPVAAATAAPRAAPTPSAAPPSAGFHPERIPAPLAAASPSPPAPPVATPAPVAAPPAAPAGRESAGGTSFGLGAAVVGANLFYVPAKLAYAGIGACIGSLALLLAHDVDVANDIWVPTLGGDYLIRGAHLQGEVPLHFLGGG